MSDRSEPPIAMGTQKKGMLLTALNVPSIGSRTKVNSGLPPHFNGFVVGGVTGGEQRSTGDFK